MIDSELLDNLTAQARQSPRLRMHHDLRTSPADQSQRMLNAMEPGTQIPIHRHRDTSEVVVVLRGRLRQNFYDDRGRLTETRVLAAGSSCPIMVVEKDRWHNSEPLESGTVIFEAKDGAFRERGADDVLTLP